MVTIVNDATQLLGLLGLSYTTDSFKSNEVYPSFIFLIMNQV
jgi:hypothetical protein